MSQLFSIVERRNGAAVYDPTQRAQEPVQIDYFEAADELNQEIR